ncbi:hypothetical protein SDC9_148581 [bioreactor metagenome]|uniref:Uncharacterized protein n=1 Tax=bioreactor metagenome TaxID=1076179 RepID=A0A645EJC2_9ZZZZ
MGFRYRGDQKAYAYAGHQEESCRNEQQQHASPDGDIEPLHADKAYDDDINKADGSEGEGFAQYKLN